jgi:putative two-component system hydrogenase maturation factor HypX/HoxX
MRTIFFDPEAPYHALRRAFVRKEAVPARTASSSAAATAVADS